MLSVVRKVEDKISSALNSLYPGTALACRVHASLEQQGFELYSPICLELAALKLRRSEEIALELLQLIKDPIWEVRTLNGYLQFRLVFPQLSFAASDFGVQAEAESKTVLIPFQTIRCNKLSHLRLCAAALVHFGLLRVSNPKVSLYFGDVALSAGREVGLGEIFRRLLVIWKERENLVTNSQIQKIVADHGTLSHNLIYWGDGPYWPGLKGEVERRVEHVFPAEEWLFDCDPEALPDLFLSSKDRVLESLLLYLAGPTLGRDLDLAAVTESNFDNLTWFINATEERVSKHLKPLIGVGKGIESLRLEGALSEDQRNLIVNLYLLDLLNFEGAWLGGVPKLLGIWRRILIGLNAEMNVLLKENVRLELPFSAKQHLICYGANHALSAMLEVLRYGK